MQRNVGEAKTIISSYRESQRDDYGISKGIHDVDNVRSFSDFA